LTISQDSMITMHSITDGWIDRQYDANSRSVQYNWLKTSHNS